MQLVVLPLALVLGVVACGGDEADNGQAAAGDGEALYGEYCASCHGADLRGTDEGPSHLSVVYEPGHHPDASFRAAVQEGAAQHHWDFGDMPPVEDIDDAEIDAVIDYVRSQQEEQGFEPYPPTG